MPNLALLIIGLTLLGALSPLLTFVALFQQKEWRLDRLKEHLRRDGWLNQLFGKMRPAIVGLYLVLTLLTFTVLLPRATSEQAAQTLLLEMLLVLGLSVLILTLLSMAQFLLGRQRKPVWTSKAILITALSYLLTCSAVIAALAAPLLLPLIVILQPLMVLVAWALLKPLDTVLKYRLMNKAMAHRRNFKNTTVIGIAGSVGKTTTKELIAHLLQDLHPHVTPAHTNTEMGVAAWILKQPASSPLLIVEMGAYAKGEISLLCRIAQPTMGVITALGSDHLALFGSEEAIVKANGELIAALSTNGHAFLYGDNDGCKKLAATALCPVTLTGSKELAATHIKETPEGIQYSILNTQYSIPLHGTHNVHNALLAIGVAKHLGITNARIAELLKTFKAPAHTFNVRTENSILLLDDTYNISPLSMRAAIDWLGTQKGRPRTLLTSGLQETGHRETLFLRELGERAKGKIERVIFLHAHGAPMFAKGYGKDVEVMNAATVKVEADSVLACVGRMPLSSIQKILPQ